MCLVAYKPGLLTCYLNGKIASQTSLERGSFEDWQESSYSLVFGNEVYRQVVTAEMLEKAHRSIAPYRRALVINRYKIKESKSAHFN